ncbi:MAG: hypothetical protein ACP5JG_07665 [Anaerolineae bacterium]
MSRKRPSFLGVLLMLVLVGGLVVWWVSALTNEDPLWFLRTFKARADWITLYWEGEVQMYFPGDAGYERIMDAFAEGIAHWSGYESGVELSDESLETCRNQTQLLELHFNEPVRVHTRHLYPEARDFFVPLSGTHAEWCRVFAGLTTRPRIGALDMSEEHFKALQEAVKASTALDDAGD